MSHLLQKSSGPISARRCMRFRGVAGAGRAARCGSALLTLLIGAACPAQTTSPTQPAPHHEGMHDHGHAKSVVAPTKSDASTAERDFAEAQNAQSAGRFADAARLYGKSRDGFAKAGHPDRYVAAAIGLINAQSALGQQVTAIASADEALAVAREAQDVLAEGRLQAARARAAMFSREADTAEDDLIAAEIIARREDDSALLAEVSNDQGTLYAARGQTVRALEAYDTAMTAAELVGDGTMRATIAINTALAAVQGDHSTARERVDKAVALSELLPKSGYVYVHSMLTVSDIYAELAAKGSGVSENDARASYSAAMMALNIATAEGATLLQSQAWGRLGALYAARKRPDDALFATRKAVFLAQQSQSADAIFRMQWQVARQLRDRGEIDPAIDAYKRALLALRGIRHDLAIGYGNANSRTSFRQSVGPVFYEAADLLLRRADELGDEGLRQESLKLARDTVEQFKSAELEDYFQDDCVNLIKQKARGIDIGLVNTAIVYLIPLPDRTEILISTPRGLQRFKAAVTDVDLTAEARDLRLRLEDELDYSYRGPASKLYDWLIRPIETVLASESVDTLVFVPDGELRTVPMGVLLDRESKRHLIEKYAVAVSPGLELTDPKPLAARQKVELLAAGLSESRQNFPALPNVPRELQEIGDLYGGVQLKDAQFQRQSFANQFRGDTFSIVHIASHGKFEGNARDTFVLTYDGRLNLNDLEKLIQPSQFRGEPVELLTLSACQTAAGEDGARAALGLAGVAIKAGARSALASLWSVNDAASSELIGQFYTQLRTNPSQSKAQALQTAQVALLKQPKYRHPRYWAPYLIIGNWQ